MLYPGQILTIQGGKRTFVNPEDPEYKKRQANNDPGYAKHKGSNKGKGTGGGGSGGTTGAGRKDPIGAGRK